MQSYTTHWYVLPLLSKIYIDPLIILNAKCFQFYYRIRIDARRRIMLVICDKLKTWYGFDDVYIFKLILTFFFAFKQNSGIRDIITICHDNIMDNIHHIFTNNERYANEWKTICCLKILLLPKRFCTTIRWSSMNPFGYNENTVLGNTYWC